MLPAHLAENIRKQVLYYLQSTFDFRDREVGRAFERFLQDPENGIFKGPWVQLRRPFRPAEPGIDPPFDIKPPFHPFRHQWQAWRRLSSKEQSPQPTLVTTGTGSGKTECFLYPLLDHCLRMRGEGQKGIKAIILYPMNALAADQEKRFAKAVWGDPTLKSAGIRVGNYTGRYDPADPGAAHDSGTKAMGEDHGISNHGIQQETPPDILLTNYKMLDFLLLRPQDQRLWRFNEPHVLRYLVLDELHTYDGAQGADVACLIRRLKERLEIPKGELCVVGTSATMDDRSHTAETTPGTEGPSDAIETSGDRLARFASTLFEEDVPTESVIGEDRLTVEEIVHAEREEIDLPAAEECVPRGDEDVEAYARRQVVHWGGPGWQEPSDQTPESQKAASEAWAIELGEWLKGAAIFERLLTIFERSERDGDGPLSWNDLVERLTHADLAFADVPEREKQKQIIVSLFALVAQARERRSGVAFPLVPTQVQLWIRELARLGRVVNDLPAFGWLDEPTSGVRSLPAFHCSECGESGWIGVHDPSRDTAIESQGVSGIQLGDEPKAIYGQWFGYKGARGQKIVVISPWPLEGDAAEDTEADGQQTLAMTHWYFCPLSLILRRGNGPCPVTGDGRRFRVRVDRNSRKTQSGRVEGIQGCPACGSRDGVFIIGTRSATLSSVVIDEMFGSILNSDPKLLAFTDSVQDASHRAGFFTARTYNFTFRTALQHVIEDVGDAGVSLPQSSKLLLDWWGSVGPGRPGSTREAIASMMPPDLQEYEDFLKYRNSDTAEEPPRALREDIESRLAWQATSEFGIMQLHGRSMEESGSACVAWDAGKVDVSIQRLRDRLEGIDTALCGIPEESFRVWLYGVLHRYRLRGAVDHPYLKDLATKNFWGKYPFGRTVPGRETYPPLHRFRPQLMVTRSQRDHQHILASTTGGMSPWHLKWAYRSLGGPVVQEAGILDLIAAMFDVGSEVGLFRKLHQDGSKVYYTISADSTRLCPGGSHLVCSESGRSIVRPADEATLWVDAPSLEYYADRGRYALADYTPRQRYYQDRYRKGALRRVVANEHTGLLATEDREQLERDFAATKHTDDPNVLTCTSTLEMGIDIGDLSSTMLCSIPPRTANYLQRIGRAGRATGTALIISVINQRPHDLFFYARPIEMLRGRVDPPGCWLDASAVLVRQYLAFCFDSATKAGELTELPASGVQFVRDMDDPSGRIPTMMSWVAANEAELRARFLRRFHEVVREDTRERVLDETTAELLLQRLHAVAQEFDRQRRDLENARKRLADQLSKLDENEDDARREIEQELHILKGRRSSLGRTTMLEVLTDHGLLPNYAFPERGVRFYGSVYNRHRRGEREIDPIEVVRPAASAIRELAPGNHFYTHRRKFDIQQLSVGNPQDPLIETWAICGPCGHMRRKEDLEREDANPACPQCGYDGASDSQADRGQQRQFIEFSRSQALSYMEQYDSMSGDRNDDRDRAYYLQARSFDLTDDDQVGAVGEDDLPFGVEYRAAVTLREANVGFDGEPATVRFGPGQEAPEIGFAICKRCGIVAGPGEAIDQVKHRRSCTFRRKAEDDKQKGKQTNPYQAESVYLYRQLRSEAIRLLVPALSDEELDTLAACLFLGLRLRFEGDPGHLRVFPQRMPDISSPINRYYLVLLDSVPGGTGYLKTLYQERDDQDRPGEGIMTVLKLALDALETCTCRRLHDRATEQDTDGCYRCIRTYHQQYKADHISREAGIRLLRKLIEAGEHRVAKQDLGKIELKSLFESMLEKRLVDRLQAYVVDRGGAWDRTMVRGKVGFRFSVGEPTRMWELELQPKVGSVDSVGVASQPDFMLRCLDDDSVMPVAVFTDGFDPHVVKDLLPDDMEKRRAILASGAFHVWSVTWSDLTTEHPEYVMACPDQLVSSINTFGQTAKSQGTAVPRPNAITRNAFVQLCAFIECPNAAGWRTLAEFTAARPLIVLSEHRSVVMPELKQSLDAWRMGSGFAPIEHNPAGDWVYNDKAGRDGDVLTFMSMEDAISNRRFNVQVVARLGNTEGERNGSDYRERWRRFLSVANLYQFAGNFRFWVSSEAVGGTAPDLAFHAAQPIDDKWQEIREETVSALRSLVDELAAADAPAPSVAHEDEAVGEDAFAELAWPDQTPPVAVLIGDQESFSSAWQDGGWVVITMNDLQAKGTAYVLSRLGQAVTEVH